MKTILVGVPAAEAATIRAELAARAMSIEAEVATPAEAVTRFARPDAPSRLFIVNVRTDPEAAGIRSLRTAFPSTPLVALADKSGTAAAMIAVNRAGADQVVGVPIDRADLNDALDQLSMRSQPSGRSHILVVVSGTITGTGSATVAANLAESLRTNTTCRPFSLKRACRWACRLSTSTCSR